MALENEASSRQSGVGRLELLSVYKARGANPGLTLIQQVPSGAVPNPSDRTSPQAKSENAASGDTQVTGQCGVEGQTK